MTAKELLQKQLNAAGGQVTRTFEAIDPAQSDLKVHPTALSLVDQLLHLSETYTAVLTTVAGGKQEWGSYVAPSTEWEELRKNCLALRAQAVAAVLEGDDHLEVGADYIVAHDNYHVGQAVMTRMLLDTAWDPYSIYAW